LLVAGYWLLVAGCYLSRRKLSGNSKEPRDLSTENGEPKTVNRKLWTENCKPKTNRSTIVRYPILIHDFALGQAITHPNCFRNSDETRKVVLKNVRAVHSQCPSVLSKSAFKWGKLWLQQLFSVDTDTW